MATSKHVSTHIEGRKENATYNKPTVKLSVETEADWKAGQAVDPFREIQSAIAAGDADMRDKRTVLILG
jgi:hypothetical protein